MNERPDLSTPSVSKRLPSRIDELDGLRGILALWVALSHIFCWCGFSQFPIALPHYLNSAARSAWVQFSFAGAPVDAFIILSGFAISYLLHSRTQSYKQFMTGRFFRIYPVYLLCLLAGFFTIFIIPHILDAVAWRDNEYFTLYVRPVVSSALAHPVVHLVSHLTLLFGVIPDKLLPHAAFSFVAPAWSISLEWQYYLLAPLVALWVCRPLGLAFLGIVGCGGMIYLHFWSAAFFPEMVPLFLIGIGSYHLYVHSDKWKQSPYRLHVLAAVLAAVLILDWHRLALLIWLIVFGGVLADAANPCEQFLLLSRRVLLKRPLQFIGAISYPLYLVHWPVIVGFLALLVAWQPGISSGAALALMLVVVLPIILLAAWLLHILVEKPLMQFGKKFTR